MHIFSGKNVLPPKCWLSFYAYQCSKAWDGQGNKRIEEVTQEIGRRITTVTEDTRESTFLFQRLSIALQRGRGMRSPSRTPWSLSEAPLQPYYIAYLFPPTGFVLVGIK